MPFGRGFVVSKLIWDTAVEIYAGIPEILKSLQECREKLGF